MRWLPIVALVGCGPFYGNRSPTSAPEGVVALDGVNTEFDDFNAAKPHHWAKIVWSTNRGSEGKHLDVWEAELAWSKTPSMLQQPKPFAPELMSEGNERGPVVLPSWLSDTSYDTLLVASDREGGRGGFDLYAGTLSYERKPLRSIEALNTPANEMYLTPFGTKEKQQALFASDREGGQYDIYEVVFAAGIEGATERLERVAALSSERDDTAPYVDRDIAVFASNRDGGAGGYDLYCAKRKAGAWGAPVAIKKTNSAADEFRPSLFTFGKANFLVFSSNRPGGKGGYDLYTIRFDDCPK